MKLAGRVLIFVIMCCLGFFFLGAIGVALVIFGYMLLRKVD